LAEKVAVPSCVGGMAGGAAPDARSGAAQLGQKRKLASETGVPHVGQGFPDGTAGGAGGGAGAAIFAPQNAQNGCVLSACLPQWGHFTSALPSGGWAADCDPCTRVAGTPPADALGRPTAEADIGFPQSMQNRDPSSLVRPQWAQVITVRKAPAEFAQRG
jgi:hypothetical protein